MVRESTSFDDAENIAKLPEGPISDMPGPTFEIQVRAAEKLVVMSNPSRETTKAQPKKEQSE